MGFSVEVRQEALDAVWAGESAGSVARRMGISPGSVLKWARLAGMTFKRGNGGGPVVESAPAQAVAPVRVVEPPRASAGSGSSSGRVSRAARSAFGVLSQLSLPVLLEQLAADSRQAGVGALSVLERTVIAAMHGHHGVREIARVLGRAASTISRELARNSVREGVYDPVRAHCLAVGRLPRPKARKTDDPRLRQEVVDRLIEGHSPEQIAGRLRVDFAEDASMNVSHEAIYQALYVQTKGALREELADVVALRSGRTQRKKRSKLPARSGRPWVEGRHISERPPEAEDRAVPGHWEGDLILGAGNRSAIITLVERSSRYLMLGHLPLTHDAITTEAVLTQMVATLPEHLRGSITWDQGSEMATVASFTVATGCPVFFADPHSPWQRGTNENTNGLLRQYFPKGTDLVS